MKCPDRDMFQSYIDGELEIGSRKELENHLAGCAGCEKTLKELKDIDNFVFGKIRLYSNFADENMTCANSRSQFCHSKQLIPKQLTSNEKKGVRSFMLKYKRIAIAVCVVAAVVTCTAVQPVRSAISNALSVFRVDSVKGINISLEDLKKIQEKINTKEPEITFDKIGKIKITGGQEKSVSSDDIRNIGDFTVLLPSLFPDTRPDIRMVEPSTIEFTLNTGYTNEILRTFGAKKLLPADIDGKTFTAGFARIIIMQYNVNDRVYTVTQTKAPELTVPAGVDVDDIYDSMVDLPILPENLQRQLKSIKDWKSTLYVPVIDTRTKEVDINGDAGYVYTETTPAKTGTFSWLIYKHNDVICGIRGNTGSDGIINLARSMR